MALSDMADALSRQLEEQLPVVRKLLGERAFAIEAVEYLGMAGRNHRNAR